MEDAKDTDSLTPGNRRIASASFLSLAMTPLFVLPSLREKNPWPQGIDFDEAISFLTAKNAMEDAKDTDSLTPGNRRIASASFLSFAMTPLFVLPSLREKNPWPQGIDFDEAISFLTAKNAMEDAKDTDSLTPGNRRIASASFLSFAMTPLFVLPSLREKNP